MSDEKFYRVFVVLADGRRVYFTKDGRIHLVTESQADKMLDLHGRGAHSIAHDDPSVMAADLRGYAPRSRFIAALMPFVMVVDAGKERARTPIDRAAFVLGGGLACQAGVWDGGKS